MTHEQCEPFRLLDLPPELWSTIGKMVVDTVPIDPLENWCWQELERKVRQPAICSVCRCLRAELLGYFYGARIAFPLDADYLGPVFWLSAIGPENRRSLRRVLLSRHVSSIESVELKMARCKVLVEIGSIEVARVRTLEGAPDPEAFTGFELRFL